MVGILISEDLCVVPLMLLIPSLSGEGIKDSFIGLFFVSIGMLMDIGYMSDNCLF